MSVKWFNARYHLDNSLMWDYCVKPNFYTKYARKTFLSYYMHGLSFIQTSYICIITFHLNDFTCIYFNGENDKILNKYLHLYWSHWSCRYTRVLVFMHPVQLYIFFSPLAQNSRAPRLKILHW